MLRSLLFFQNDSCWINALWRGLLSVEMCIAHSRVIFDNTRNIHTIFWTFYWFICIFCNSFTMAIYMCRNIQHIGNTNWTLRIFNWAIALHLRLNFYWLFQIQPYHHAQRNTLYSYIMIIYRVSSIIHLFYFHKIRSNQKYVQTIILGFKSSIYCSFISLTFGDIVEITSIFKNKNLHFLYSCNLSWKLFKIL